MNTGFWGQTEEEIAEVDERWRTTMARIGVAPRETPTPAGFVAFKPTSSDIRYDILDIINGICDVADRVGKAE